MSRVKSFSIPIDDNALFGLITQAAIKNDRSESWVICQALKYYFNNGESLTEDSSDVRRPSSDEVPTLPPVELPELPPRPKKGGESPPSLDAKDFVNFE